ncbi:hypothetical protein [Enterobacter asburiae]|uniref:hypothetical protein n=1 Tax=Enterobacter TaxID=547 RepID=UPI0006AC5AD7|nr:hypothetical protein [Enterobacter asburiae]MDK9982186.1 hypothetical protein [Enterobacter asburiae]MDK9990879.1 hypothetical protein [Enterobacter asburiae]HCR0953885.1 hypothetical protein [Enterobacter asburiae]HEB5026344.1 hypothetical protein [Enterobacter asburiae]
MSIKNLVVMIKHNGLLSSMSQLEKLYQAAIENEQKLAELEAHLAALAAENAGLKSAIEKHADSYIMCGYCRTERDGKNDDVCEVLDSIPATDAFLAEVRAQGADECVRQLVISDDDDFSDAPNICAMVAHQLRKGVQS